MDSKQSSRSLSLKSLSWQEWVLRLLADGPLSANEISARMFEEMWEEFAERRGCGGLVEWRTGAEPFGARLLAWGEAKDEGREALHQWQLYPHLRRIGSPCGNTVATTPSGAIIYRKCATHRRLAERERQEKLRR